ncbi:MAG: fatty acid desaturase family protein [Acidimicrobiales bacterium]
MRKTLESYGTATIERPARSGPGPGQPPASPDADYVELARQVRQAGLMDRRPGHYALRIGVNMALLAGGWVAFFLIGDSWYQLGIAAFLAVLFTQTGFIGHDAGHRQIGATRRVNELVGLVHANLAIGMSYGYWVDKHNRHHSHPNEVGRDPDVGPGAFAWTAEQARSTRGPARALVRHQAGLFFPLLVLEAANLHAFSLRAMGTRAVRHKWLEGLLLLGHAAGYVAALVIVLSPVKAVVFVVVQQGLFGLYLGCSFAPNHKGMPMPAPGEETDFLRRQVLTARNVRGGRFVSLALGGLNYQIEHHLFPTMPMSSLWRCQPIIRAFCQQHGVAYAESALLGSYVQALRHFRACGAPLRPG